MIAIQLLNNIMDYIGKVLDGEMCLLPPRRKDERCAELMEKGFQSSLSIEWTVLSGRRPTKEEELRTGYDYLMSTPIVSFSRQKMKELKEEIDTKEKELHELDKTRPKALWLKDLDALKCKLDAVRNETLSLLFFTMYYMTSDYVS